MIMPAKSEPMTQLLIRIPVAVKERLEAELAAGADKVPQGAYQAFFLSLLAAYWGEDDAA